ncbi:MAG: tRNA (adenosine(37)-N6)-threonylcarbamoyltransferase complex dimerization subunit type 1 TsaB [bacterium]|nr:tRNA (adenosine(37)-N6)-threonylcarbamoyltransferase complex dimerization subunit type 1 TsaB [bacterium]
MRLLALDSSGLVASVALVVDDTLVAEYTTNFKKTHSQTLLPMLDEIVKMTDTKLEEIDAIAVSSGPGSFTGLRIGSATAKGLGLALNKPIIGVPTVDALAYNLYATDAVICPIMDARRSQVYTGLYEFVDNQFVVMEQQKVATIAELLEELQPMKRKVIFLGDGVEVHKEQIKETLGSLCSFAPAHVAKQRAGAVAMLASEYYKQGKMESASDHAPEYLRLSQAERELAERQKLEQVK